MYENSKIVGLQSSQRFNINYRGFAEASMITPGYNDCRDLKDFAKITGIAQ